jgi:GH25 family lysozyme M1 (1,4-beta-N-acetylmuramidase)
MTLFGWDASDYDVDRGPMNMAAAHADGMTWATHKATEGSTVRHQDLGPMLTHARDAGIPFLGAYHVVRSGPSILSQVAWFLKTLDAVVPWWRTHPRFFLQVDLEKWSYDQVPASVGKAFAAALVATRTKPVITYASRGQYGDTLTGIVTPLWNATYPSSRAAPYRDLYPGDKGPGWVPYSGQTPVMWQYSSAATIGTQPRCDANAFRGDLAAFTTLIGGPSMAGTKTIDDVFDLIAGIVAGVTNPGGVPSAVPQWVNAFATHADLAGISADAKAGRIAVEALSTVLAAAGGDVNSTAVIAHMDLLAAADTDRETALHTEIAALRQQVTTLQGQLAQAGASLAAVTGAPG